MEIKKLKSFKRDSHVVYCASETENLVIYDREESQEELSSFFKKDQLDIVYIPAGEIANYFGNPALISTSIIVLNEYNFLNDTQLDAFLYIRTRYPFTKLYYEVSDTGNNEKNIEKAMNLGFDGIVLTAPNNDKTITDLISKNLFPVQKEEIDDKDLKMLAILREKIHQLDKETALLISQRIQTVKELSEIKRKYHLPIVQPKQWQAVENIYTVAMNDTSSEESIQEVLSLIHKVSVRVQFKTGELE